jgi:hypothetical protein
MRYLCGLFVLPLLLAGCGGGRGDQAVDACAAELTSKLEGKTFALDRADMLAKAKPEGDDVLTITSSVTFDAGLPGEYSQSYECKARITGGNAVVIALTFSW